MADRKRLGRWGEKQGEKFLKSKGLKTLARNFSCKTGEIDLIMVDGDGSIVFVEVRTKADESFGPPEESITQPKRARLLRAARYFLAAHKIEDRPLRFDVVTVVLGQVGRPQIRHYQNAFVR
ncbi:MAG: YraN family protein [Sedimentisphaerales bacterium]|nr:YraN family protein [Sedimentisphaerales bacterium]